MAAEVSIDNLSMPLPARQLDVGVTSIYWYFRKKDELLDAMTDWALQRYEFTVPCIDASNWRASLGNHADQFGLRHSRSSPHADGTVALAIEHHIDNWTVTVWRR